MQDSNRFGDAQEKKLWTKNGCSIISSFLDTKNKRFHDFANDFPSLLKKNSNPNLDEDETLWASTEFQNWDLKAG